MTTIGKLIIILILTVLIIQVVTPVFAASAEDAAYRKGPWRPTIGSNSTTPSYGQGGYGYRYNPNPLCPTGPGTCGTPICPTGPGTCNCR